jgi:hypothetical protein
LDEVSLIKVLVEVSPEEILPDTESGFLPGVGAETYEFLSRRGLRPGSIVIYR